MSFMMGNESYRQSREGGMEETEMEAGMLIYGEERMRSRFREFIHSEGQAGVRPVQNDIWISTPEELENFQDPETEIVVLDRTDAEIMRKLFRKGWKNICIPVCGTVLSVSSPEADVVLKKKLQGCANWKWHKEANYFRMLRSYFFRNPIMDSLPSHIQMEHTSYCNAECIMCGHAIYGNRGARHISQQMIDRIQSLMPACELMVLHGYGEPLLTKNLEQLLELYRKYGVEVTMNTNLSWLPRELLDCLVPVTRHLRISCDAVTKEIYEGIRPGLNFDRFLENIDRLKTAAPGIELMMETVIMRQNVEQIPQMVRFAWEHGFSQISLNRLGSHPVLNNERDCLIYYPELTSHYLRKGLELGEKLGIRIYYPVEWLLDSECAGHMEEERQRAAALPFCMTPLYCAEEQKQMIHNAVLLYGTESSLEPGKYSCSGMCDSLLGRTNLDLEGNVYACCMNTLQKVGNLFEMTDREFYNAPPLVKMRKCFYRGAIPVYCDSCSYVMNHTLAFGDICLEQAESMKQERQIYYGK